MKRHAMIVFLLAAVFCFAKIQAPVSAGVSPVGDVVPGLPWNSSTTGYIGQNTEGTLTVDEGSELLSSAGYIGYNLNATGKATVEGDGSKWTNGSNLLVGYSGNGTLDVTGGAAVTCFNAHIGNQSGSIGKVKVEGGGSTWTSNGYTVYVGDYGNGTLEITSGAAVIDKQGYVGYRSNSTGAVVVDGPNSKWTNSLNLGVGYYGVGTLSITNGAEVSNGSQSYIGASEGGSGAVTVAGANSKWTNNDALSVGHYGNGTLDIQAGARVSNTNCRIAHGTGTVATVKVEGAGSTWSNNGYLYVGEYGNTAFQITSGGHVSNTNGYISYAPSTRVTAVVEGTGSTWTNSGTLYVGYFGYGTLHIAGGATVSAKSVSLLHNSPGLALLAIDVGFGSSLSIDNGAGSLTNQYGGKIRFLAGAAAETTGVHSPIAAGSWLYPHNCQAVGGTWNSTTRQFTVSDVQSGTPGEMSTLNLTDIQRLLINDESTGWGLGASFPYKAGNVGLNFTAAAVGGETLADLVDYAKKNPGKVNIGHTGVWGVGFVPTHYIDVTPYMELKRRAIRAHQSQDPERFVEMAELSGRYRSAQCNANAGYAEVFRFEPVFPFADPRNLLPSAPGVLPVRDRGAK